MVPTTATASVTSRMARHESLAGLTGTIAGATLSNWCSGAGEDHSVVVRERPPLVASVPVNQSLHAVSPLTFFTKVIMP